MSSMTSLLTASRETSRLHRWTMWRMTVNEGIITCIRDQGTSRVLFPDPTGAVTHPDSQSLSESVSRDPMRHFPFVSPEEMSMARKMNLRDYYGSGHGLSEDSYFIFGLPRISNYNKDVPDVTSQGTHSAYGSVNDLRHALGQDPAATSTDRRQTNPAAYNLLMVNTGTNGNTPGREVNPTYAEVRLGQDYRAPPVSNINMGTDSHNTTNGYRYQEINGNRPRENDEQFQSAWSRQGPSMDRALGDHDPSWPKPALPPQSRSPPVVPRLDLYSIQEEFDNNRNTSRTNRDQPPQQRYRESTKANGYDPNQLYSNPEINRLSKPYSGYEMHRLNSTNGDASERYASARHGNTMDAPSRFNNNMDAPSRSNNMEASTRFSNNVDASRSYGSTNVDPARHSYAESGRYENVAQNSRYENVAQDGRYGNVTQDGRYGNVAQDGRYGNVAQNGRYENTAQHGFPASHEREDATYSSPHYRKTTPPPVSPKPANYQPFFAPGPAPHLSVKQQAEAYTRQLSQAEAHPRTQSQSEVNPRSHSQSDVHGRSQYDVNPRSHSDAYPRPQSQSDVHHRPQSESYTRQAEPYPRPRSEVYPPFSPNRPGYSPSAKASQRPSFFPPSENHEPGYLAGRQGHASPPPAPDRMRTGMYEGQKAPRPTSLLGGGRRSPDDAERIEREKRQVYYDWSTPTAEKYVFSDFTTSNYNRFS